MDRGGGDDSGNVAARIAAQAAAVGEVVGMMSLLDRRSEALALHSDALTVLTRALRDLQRAADSPDPVFWLQSALEQVHTTLRIVERLGEGAELLRRR